MINQSLTARLRKIKLVILDVDGVLTDGRLFYGANGEQLKVFHSLDGHGLKMLAGSGVVLAIISGRTSRALAKRARDLGIKHLMMGVENKAVAFQKLCQKTKFAPLETASIGDDIVDLPILLHCGFSACVPNAPADVKKRVDYVTKQSGGQGAVREFCEVIMRAQGSYRAALQHYLA